ncbi:MAG: hypothetical protein WBX11_11965 [Thiobacillaceae bacterium]
MTMNYSSTLDSTTYLQQLQAFIKAVEDEKFPVYVDSTGNPTIGWGFALNDAHLTTINALNNIIEQVLGVDKNRKDANNQPALSSTAQASEAEYEKSLIAILNQSWPADTTTDQTGQSTKDLQAALKAKLDQRAADIVAHKNGYTAADQAAIGTPVTAFAYSTANQIAATFDVIKPVIDGRLNASLGSTVPNTNERIALFAMQYLGAMNSKMKGLLNTALNQSDPNDARAQAWYAIRYLNPAKYAQRSYMEAAMFGLFAPGQTVTEGAALAAYRVYTQHSTDMLAWDTKHSGDLVNANDNLGSLADALDVEETLWPAATELINTYAPGQSFDPLNIFVASDGFSDTVIGKLTGPYSGVLLIGANGSDTLIGTTGNDRLVAGTGTDTLVGGNGNDTFVGGSGNDLLIGGVGTDTFIYSAVANNQNVTETIDDSVGKGHGSIWIGSTQLPTTKLQYSGTPGLWTLGTTQFQFQTNQDGSIKLTISQGLLGNGQIIINNFDWSKAQTDSGYLGIHLPTGVSIQEGSKPLTVAQIYAQTNTAIDPPPGALTLTAYVTTISDTPQTLTLSLSQGDPTAFAVDTGHGLVAFNNNAVTLTVAPGDDSVSFSLVNTKDVPSAEAIQLTATFNDPSTGTPISSTVEVDYTASPPLSPSPTNVVTGQAISADQKASYFNADTLYKGTSNDDQINMGNGTNFLDASSGTLSGGNDVIVGGTGRDYIYAGGGNGNNVISGGGGQDVIWVGNGTNRIYANSQTDLATALSQAATLTPTGQKGSFIAVGSGDNTLVGGNGSDLFVLGGGNDIVICGPGNDTIVGGVKATAVVPDWSTQNNVQTGPGAPSYTVLIKETSLSSSGGYVGPAIWPEANIVEPDGGVPAGGGSETIFGGAGNDIIWGSNGPGNYIDIGQGNSTVFSGAGNDTVFAGAGNSTINGQAGDDYIEGGSGNQYIEGGSGNNTIFGGTGSDTLYAGQAGSNWDTFNQGNNYVDGGTGNSLIFGAGGNDTLIAGSGSTTILGGAGNESMEGGDGHSVLYSGSSQGVGSDTLVAGNGDNTLYGGQGTDFIYGGNGTDVIYGGSGATEINLGDGGTATNPNQVHVGSGITTVYGGFGVDQIYGGSGQDTLIAGDGNATLQGGSGTEEMMAGAGTDMLIAGSGNDTLFGGAGTATLQGGSGTTLMVAGGGDNTLIGGSGQNTYEVDPGFGNVAIQPGSAGDTLLFGSGIGLADLSVTGNVNAAGQSVLELDVGSGGSISIVGGLTDSLDHFNVGGATYTLQQLLQVASTTPNEVAGATGDLIFSATAGDALAGTGGNDTIAAYGANTTLSGGGGDTTFIVTDPTQVVAEANSNVNDAIQSSVSYVLPANVQNLTLYGQGDLSATGNDLANVLSANGGNDSLIAGSGVATLVGGVGKDTFVVNNTADVVQAQANAASNTVQSSVNYVMPENVQTLMLTANGDLTATGNDQANVIQANNGNDTLIAGSGITTLVGGIGNDTFVVNNAADVVTAQANPASNTVQTSVSYVAPANVQNLTGTGTADLSLTGNNVANMTLTANAGNDTLRGGSGSGTLVGGAGQDTFVLAAAGNYTAIKAGATDATVQLDPGLVFSDVTAVQSGNDLVLQVGGTASSLRVQDYFLDPQAWTIQDASGNSTTAQALLDATAQASANTLAQLESQFFTQVKAGYIQQLVGWGFSRQADGSWYIGPSANDQSAGAQYTVQNDTTNYLILNDSGSVQQSTLTNQYTAWTSSGLYIEDQRYTIQNVVINAASPVVDVGQNSTMNNVLDNVWLSVNWNAPQLVSTQTYHYARPVGSSGTGAPIVMSEYGTVQDYAVSGTPSNGLAGSILSAPGSLTTQGDFPQAIQSQFLHLQTTDLIEQLNLGSGDHTVNASSVTLVNAGSGNNTIWNPGFVDAGTGNDVIYNAGTVYSESGNDTIYGANSVYGGSGNDLIVGASTVITGSGNDTIFGAGPGTVTVNPGISGMDVIGNVSNQDAAFLDAYYQAQGISDGAERYQYADLYHLVLPDSVWRGWRHFSPDGYYTAQDALNIMQGFGYTDTLQQAIDSGLLTYVAPLPSLISLKDGAQPAAYYATSGTPVTATIAANNFTALAPYFDSGAVPAETVHFGPGIGLANLQFFWGTVTTDEGGYALPGPYTTLNISWGQNQGIQVIMPHQNDPIGSGVQEFVFADGTTMSMAQMIALAPPAPSFDPEIFNFKPGMGQQVLPSYARQVVFGAGINLSSMSLSQNGTDLVLADQGGADTLTIPNGAADPTVINSLAFSFADGSTLSYAGDGQGDATFTHYNNQGNKIGDLWIHSDGSSGSDTYNPATGASSGHTLYADGSTSTYTNDGQGNSTTLQYDPQGHETGDQWTKSDGSSGYDTYNAVTGEVTGSNAPAGAGYRYTYDNTQNVGGVSGVSESKVDYTYSDGSTYSTDTVSDPNGSYQQSWSKSDGSSGSTDYNAASGEVSGSNATAGAGYSYTYDNTQNVGGVSGVTESKVDYTYTDGSTYFTDTVSDPDGSYQQSWSKSDGSSGSTDYNAATGEVSGSNAPAGAGYSYTYDNTQNVAGVSGVTESKVDYTYTDGSTYFTDTVSDPNGSYQQSWSKSDGSSGSTDYNAVTGEVSGSNATAGAGYSYTYDNTQNVGGVSGVTESKVDYTYTDGSTYATDTVSNPDGSYFQSWSKSDGTAGSSAVNANGTLVGDSWVSLDGSQGVDAGGNHLLMGGAANDALSGQSGNDLFIGGPGNDTITSGSGANIIAFDKGDGADVVNAAAGATNALSLGGGINYADLSFSKSGNDLILNEGTDTLTFKDWYASSANQNFVTLQVIEAASSTHDAASTSALYNNDVVDLSFTSLVNQFNAALADTPTLTQWSLTNGLLTAYLSGSNTEAIGGDLAYYDGLNGGLSGMNVAAAQAALRNPSFGTAAQSISAWSSISQGAVAIH